MSIPSFTHKNWKKLAGNCWEKYLISEITRSSPLCEGAHPVAWIIIISNHSFHPVIHPSSHSSPSVVHPLKSFFPGLVNMILCIGWRDLTVWGHPYPPFACCWAIDVFSSTSSNPIKPNAIQSNLIQSSSPLSQRDQRAWIPWLSCEVCRFFPRVRFIARKLVFLPILVAG